VDAFRRQLLATVAAVAALALAPASAAAAVEAAKPADSFVDSIGVNTHTSYDDTVYHSRFDAVRQRLAELGVRHIREGLKPNRPDQYEHLNALAGIGAKATLILGEPEIGSEGLEELIATLKENVLGSVEAVEGPNEIDMTGDASRLPYLGEYQQHLYSAVKADPALAALPVVGPSLVHRRNQEALGDISGSLDYGNIHSYPGGEAPEGNLSTHFASAANNSGGKPLMATETGYHSAVGWTGEHDPASEAAMATYMPRLYLEYFRRGVVRTFSYELVDEGTSGDSEDNFGLLRNDLSEKPAFAALRNTIAILGDPGPAFEPETLDYALGGDRSNLRQVLLQKRDGTFYLALWRASSVWDTGSRTPVDAPSAPVKLSFERQVKGVQRYLPGSSPAPLGPVADQGNSLSVNVGPQVVILRLQLGAMTPGRIKIEISRRSVPAGGRVAVKGRLPKQLAGRSLRVKIQQWQGHGWRTVGRSRTRRSGVFRKKIRVPAKHSGRASRVRVVAGVAKPSRAVRVRIRR
jgi:hypothetical protein